jgi:hypothetical protein
MVVFIFVYAEIKNTQHGSFYFRLLKSKIHNMVVFIFVYAEIKNTQHGSLRANIVKISWKIENMIIKTFKYDIKNTDSFLFI